MTTPQSGREAFEAWAEREFGKAGSLPATERFASYWKCWQAALAQQGREVGEAVAWVCDRDGEKKLGEPFFATNPKYVKQHKNCNWHPLYLHAAAPKQQAVEVTEEMVDRACNAFYVDDGWRFNKNGSRDDIRAALLAALPGKTEVE